jgi:glycosyltransferase involved in cell wall biosynthesis
VSAEKTGPLCIVWPHRWEHDKDPSTFFSVLLELERSHSVSFSLIVLGESYGEHPPIFAEALSQLSPNSIRHWGFAQSRADYEHLLSQGDVVVSTAQHEFFGVAMLEACRAGCVPLVPDRLAYKELYPNEQHRYRTRTQLLKKLKEYCQHVDYVRQRAPKRETNEFEWEKNPNIREQYQQLFEIETSSLQHDQLSHS